jgi:hypothetical protein
MLSNSPKLIAFLKKPKCAHDIKVLTTIVCRVKYLFMTDPEIRVYQSGECATCLKKFHRDYFEWEEAPKWRKGEM